MLSAKAKSAFNRIRYAFLPGAAVGICRVRHDFECASKRGGGVYPYLSRFYDPKIKKIRGLPETVRFFGGSSHVMLSEAWQRFFFKRNTLAAANYLKRLQSGWVNYGPWPKVEQLTCGGSFVVVDRIEGDRAYIRSYHNNRIPDDYAEDYLQQFGVIYTNDTFGLPDCGQCFTFAIANPGEQLYMHTSDLTFLRKLA